MTSASPNQRSLAILLLSDSTGETVSAAMRAAIAQFPGVAPTWRTYPFIRRTRDLDDIEPSEFEVADVLAFTIVNPELRARIEEICQLNRILALPLLDPLVAGLGRILGRAPSTRPGQQYEVNTTYLERVLAVDYAISSDDGQTSDRLLTADVVLTGVSRTSKTPTCIYLAYQGVKAANVPLVAGQPDPPALLEALAAGIPVIGLTASVSRLSQIRQTRLRSIGGETAPGYTDRSMIEEELVTARLFFDRHDIPVIDVTRRSIEETAASIRHHLGRVRDQG